MNEAMQETFKPVNDQRQRSRPAADASPGHYAGRNAAALPDNRPQSALQRKLVSGMSGPPQAQPVQRVVKELKGSKLSPQMIDRFDKVYTRFNSAVLSSEYLAQGDNNQVLLYAVSKAGTGMSDYGATTIYINDQLHEPDDLKNFTELWDIDEKKDINKDSIVRIVITLNLTTNTTIEELYATLLHEWNVHAVKWQPVVESIRAGSNLPAELADSVGAGKLKPGGEDSFILRADKEHKDYANLDDEALKGMINTLKLEDTGLEGEALEKVKRKILLKMTKNDRDTYDKETGKVIGTSLKKNTLTGSNAKGRALEKTVISDREKHDRKRSKEEKK